VSLLWAKRGWLTPGSQTIRTLDRFGATDAWDFVDNSYMRAGVVTTNAGLTVTRASEGYAQREDGIWVNFASGALRRTDKGALIEGLRTNRALHSRDLTQAAWTATNVTVARSQVGIDGLANTACSLTATAGNGTVLQAVTDASKARYFSVWIKRITGTGTIEVTLDNGSTWTAVTVTSVYTRVGATQTLANPTVGVRIVTSGDAVAVDFAQLEDGAFSSSPIATEGTAVTRAADDVSVSASGFSYPLSIIGAMQTGVGTGATTRSLVQFYVDGNNVTGLRIASTDAGQANVITLGSTVANVLTSNTNTAGTIAKLAARLQVDNVNVALDGTAATADTSAAFPAMSSVMQFGANGVLVQNAWGYIRNIAVVPRALTNAELQGATS
jgi:hypothetical protein